MEAGASVPPERGPNDTEGGAEPSPDHSRHTKSICWEREQRPSWVRAWEFGPQRRGSGHLLACSEAPGAHPPPPSSSAGSREQTPLLTLAAPVTQSSDTVFSGQEWPQAHWGTGPLLTCPGPAEGALREGTPSYSDGRRGFAHSHLVGASSPRPSQPGDRRCTLWALGEPQKLGAQTSRFGAPGDVDPWPALSPGS